MIAAITVLNSSLLNEYVKLLKYQHRSPDKIRLIVYHIFLLIIWKAEISPNNKPLISTTEHIVLSARTF